MYGYIYLTTNIINNKIYIGKHKSEVFDPNYYGSGKLLRYALSKYGNVNFTVQMLQSCESLQELNQMEKFYIHQFNSTNIHIGYNISHGGDGGNTTGGRFLVHLGNFHKFVYATELPNYLSLGYTPGLSDDFRQKIKASRPARFGKNNPWYGKHHSESTKRLIGLSAKGRPGYGDANISKRPEVRAKLSQKAKRSTNYFKTHKFYYINNGDIELRVVQDGHELPDGFVIGRLSHCWVHNTKQECCILTKHINSYLSKGYVRGRISRKSAQTTS